MEATQMKETATSILTSGYANEATEDDMKMAMMQAGIPFSQLAPLFKGLSIDLGFIVDPKVVTANIKAQVEESAWESLTSWEQVKACVTQIEEEVKGATYMRIMQLVKPFCKEKGIDLPEEVKAASGTRANAFMVTAVDYFNGNEAPTKDGMFAVTLETIPVTAKNKEEKCRQNINKIFHIMWAVKYGVSLKEASVAVAPMAFKVAEEAPVEPSDELM